MQDRTPHLIISSSGFFTWPLDLWSSRIGRNRGERVGGLHRFAARLLHPLHVEARCWIASVPDVGCGFFYLLAFLLFLRAEKAASGRVVRWQPSRAHFPALFFKETAFSLPLLLVGLVVFLSWRRPNFAWQGSSVEHVRCCRGCLFGRPHCGTWKLSGAAHPWRMPAEDHSRPPSELLGHHAKLFFWASRPQRFSRFRSSTGPALAVAVADPAWARMPSRFESARQLWDSRSCGGR